MMQQWSDEHMAQLVDWLDRGGNYQGIADQCGMTIEGVRCRVKRYRLRQPSVSDTAYTPTPSETKLGVADIAPLAPRVKLAGLDKSTRHYIGAVSCTHYGGRHPCTEELNDWVDWAHDKYGITTVYHAGDLLQGIDPKWSTEAKRNALDDQCDTAVAELPQRDWLGWLWIAGNHDMKHEHVGGLDVGRYVDFRFSDAGRTDLRYLGPFEASHMLSPPGAPRPLRVDLRHHYGGGEHLEATLRRFARLCSRKGMPDFLLAGHPHRAAYAATPFGCHCAFVGCFDVARYGRAYAGRCDIGGTVLGFELREDGSPFRVSYEFREYDVEQRV